MKKSDINLIESFVNHMGKVFDYMPNLHTVPVTGHTMRIVWHAAMNTDGSKGR